MIKELNQKCYHYSELISFDIRHAQILVFSFEPMLCLIRLYNTDFIYPQHYIMLYEV